MLTHWGWVMHICVSTLTIFGSEYGLSPGLCQAIIWTNAGILSIGLLGTKFSEILIEIFTFSLKKIHLKMSSGKWWPFCAGLNVLRLMCWRNKKVIKIMTCHLVMAYYLNQCYLIISWTIVKKHHGRHAGNLNPSYAGTRIFWINWVTNISDDVLVKHNFVFSWSAYVEHRKELGSNQLAPLVV